MLQQQVESRLRNEGWISLDNWEEGTVYSSPIHMQKHSKSNEEEEEKEDEEEGKLLFSIFRLFFIFGGFS